MAIPAVSDKTIYNKTLTCINDKSDSPPPAATTIWTHCYATHPLIKLADH